MPLDSATLANLRGTQWREPHGDRRRLWLALLVAAFLHVAFLLVLQHEMRPPAEVAVVPELPGEAIQIRFIQQPPVAKPVAPVEPPAALPEPQSRTRTVVEAAPPVPKKTTRVPLPASPAPVPLPAPSPVSKDAMTVQLPPSKPAEAQPQPNLYAKDGTAKLPPASSASAPTPSYVQNAPPSDAKIMQHVDIMKYKPTHFDPAWKGGGSVDNALQSGLDKVTAKHTFHLPGGIRIHCSISPFGGGCGGDPPQPPSHMDGDERLSMAPAKPLATDPHPPKPPSVDECVKMYRAGKPLIYGCPFDTPNRAVDAEMKERANRFTPHS